MKVTRIPIQEFVQLCIQSCQRQPSAPHFYMDSFNTYVYIVENTSGTHYDIPPNIVPITLPTSVSNNLQVSHQLRKHERPPHPKSTHGMIS
jgi:hypothetical protein